MRITKDKIPKEKSFPLKSSVFEKAINEAGINTEIILMHCSSKIFFDARYLEPNRYSKNWRLFVRSGAVENSLKHEATELLNTHVIPEFIEWAKGIISLPENSTELLDNDAKYFRRNFT